LSAREHTKTRLAVLSVVVLAGLVLSGVAIGPSQASNRGSSAAAVPAPPVSPPGSLARVTTTTLHAQGPTYAGPASRAIIGPFPGTPSAASPALTNEMNRQLIKAPIPLPTPREKALSNYHGAMGSISGSIALPSVSCVPLGAGCDSISTSSGGATGVKGLNAIDSSGIYGLTVEPADQGLCAGNGYVMEDNNIGELEVFHSSSLSHASSDISLDSVMGLPNIPASMGGPWSSGGDTSCLYDYNDGGHWFITEIVSNSSWAVAGPFGGCFAGKALGCWEGIAVSTSSNPLGSYNVYFMNANYNSSEPGYPYLLNDFAKIGSTQDAFLVFYDEFPLLYPSVPGLGGGFLNGAQEFAINKKALELGLPVTTSFGSPNPYFTMAIENMGLLATPNGSCASTGGFYCWFQVIPAQSPDPTQFDNTHGGSGFMLESFDFVGQGDNRIAIFDWTGLKNLNSYACGQCTSIHFGGQEFDRVNPYFDPGVVAPQKDGKIPLGHACVAYGLNSSKVSKCPEGGIASNGDGFTQASFAGDHVWGAQSTEIDQTFATGSGCPCTETHLGVAYDVIGTKSFDNRGVFKLTNQGYISGAHEELEFPAMAGEGSSAADGGNLGALITFALNGDGGPSGADHGGFFPSTAYGWLTASGTGLTGKVIYVADLGKAPQDGFSEYQGFPGATRPRWGDYSEAIFVPNSGGAVYFATNYIQSPNCSAATFLVDPSCGGTRDPFANWGTSVNFAT
jgi:hypothetical protein